MFLAVFGVSIVLALKYNGLVRLLVGGEILLVAVISVWRVLFVRLSTGAKRRARLGTVLASTLIGISPFFGAAGYTFAAPGGDPLPTVEIAALALLFRPLYVVGELLVTPVGVAIFFLCGPPYDAMIFFDHSRVRPFAVFVIWVGIAASFGSSLAIEQVRIAWNKHGPRAL